MNGSYLNCAQALGDLLPSLGALLAERAARFGVRAAFKERKADGAYHALSWDALLAKIQRVGSGLLALGSGKGDRVAVYSRNSEEMLVWELATMSVGALSVPIFSRYAPDQVQYILEHSGARLLLVPDEAQLERVLGIAAFERLERVVVVQGGERVSMRGRLLAWADLAGPEEAPTAAQLRAWEEASAAVRVTDPCLVMYTSGTTGPPKGVVLLHRNILSQQQALSQLWDVGPGDRFLAYLPWHHSFGGLFERFTALATGATLCLDDSFGRDLPRLLHNWREIRPTVFFSVPKVFGALVTEARLDPEVDRTLFHPGLKFVFTAAAPLPADCSAYFAAKGVPVVEGWGLTETSPCVTITPPGSERVSGVVGGPLPGVEVLVTEEHREILVRGPNVMAGYYRDPERTARAIDCYGWLHTGDLGEITALGLRIICRADGLFKLTNGEKVSSMAIENALTSTSRFIEQAIAVGAGKEFIGALVFPNLRNLRAWAASHGKPEAAEDLVADPEVQDLIAAEVEQQNELLETPYYRVRAFALVPRELTLEAGELTPSMKVVRNRVLERYGDLVEALYRTNGPGGRSGGVVVRLGARR